jgi:hypothetical protein
MLRQVPIYTVVIISELCQPDVVTKVIQINSLASPTPLFETVFTNDGQCLADKSICRVLECKHFTEHWEGGIARYRQYEERSEATGSDVLVVFAHTVLVAFQPLYFLSW